MTYFARFPAVGGAAAGVVVQPSGANDWPRLIAQIAAATALGLPVFMAGGTWHCDTSAATNNTNVPSGAMLVMDPTVVIESSLVPSGGQTESVFTAVPQAPAGSVDTTLSAPAAAGTRSLVLTSLAIGAGGANVAVGDTVVVGEGNRFFYYVVGAVNVGTKTLTVDRALVTSYAAGVAVGVRTVPTGIRIYGNGATIRGTGDRAVNLSGAFNCEVSDLVVEPNAAGAFFADTPVAFDIGGRFSRFERIRVDNGGLGLSCMSLESCESCEIDSCELRRGNAAHACLLVGASYFCKISKTRAVNGAGKGVWLQGGGGADTYGARSNDFDACEVHDNAGTGVTLEAGSSFNDFRGCSFQRNGALGAYLGNDAATEAVRENVFSACHFGENTSGDVQSVAGSTGNVLSACTFEGSGGYAIDASGDLVISDAVTRESNSFLQVGAAANVQLDGVRARRTASAFWALVALSTTGKVTVSRVQAEIVAGAATTLLFSHVSGDLSIQDVRITAGAPTLGYSSAASAAAKLRRGRNVELSPCVTPYAFGAGSLQNFGSVALVAGAAVVANAMITAQDQVRTQRTVMGAAPGQLTAVAAAGTITLASSNGADVGTIAYDFGS